MFQAKDWRVVPAIISTAILSFSGVLIETSMNVTFPKLMTEFQVDATSIQWVTTGNLLAVAVIVPLSAYLIKNYSERNIFIAANILFLLGMAIDSLAPNLPILLIGRVLQGMGTGIALPLLFHIIMQEVPIERRGLIMGIATMTTSLAPAIGPTYGGFVLALLGWKMIFVLLFPILIVSTIIGLRSIPKKEVLVLDSLNFAAFISLGVALSCLLLAIEKLSILLLVLAILAFILFYQVNKRLPLLKLSVFKNKAFMILLLGVLAYQMLPLALSFILPNHLQIVLHQSSIKAGLFMFPGAILAAFLYPFSGHLLDKIGAFKPILSGMSCAILGLFLMTLALMKDSLLFLLMSDILVKLGMGIGASNMITMALTKLRQSESADGNSLLNTLQQFSGAFATAVASQFFAMGKNSGLANGLSLGARNGTYFILLLLVLSLGGIIYLRVKKELT
ncbi:MFS transporter [Streptococcus catagoni]|uniref:MFS transporter n=1 Tax=Streptococcus catagoni TaxID=2654874 RepID=UPI001407DB20|nr:MFS transporter [Streptococcus catagoni]